MTIQTNVVPFTLKTAVAEDEKALLKMDAEVERLERLLNEALERRAAATFRKVTLE